MEGYTEVFAWGSDSCGQLGLAHKDKGRSYSLPRFCCFNVFIKSISCGTVHSAFIEASGLLYTIGSNADGRLGVGKRAVGQSKSPCLVEALAHVRIAEVACGGGHTLAVDEQGHAYAWGTGDSGALGCGSLETQWAPVEVSLPKGFSALGVAAGHRHSALIGDTAEKTGLLLTFGWGDEGQLGTGRKQREALPVLIPANEPIKQVSCGITHTAYVTVFGRVYTMGGNECGQLGLNHRRPTLIPTLVSELEKVSVLKVAAGSHTAVLSNDGSVYIWGNAPGIDSLVPTKLAFPRGLVDIAIGDGFGAGIDSAFQVWTWGDNSSGELGLGDFELRSMPMNVSALHSKKVKTLSCGGGFVLALGCDVRNKGRICVSSRIPQSEHLEVPLSHITPRPSIPYEPSSAYDSIPTSTREMRCKPAKSTDIDGFIQRLEARLNQESQLTALVKTNQVQEDRISDTLKLLEEERNRRKNAEMELQRMQNCKDIDRNQRIKELENALNTANNSLQNSFQECQILKRENEELRSNIKHLQSEFDTKSTSKDEISQAKCTIDKLEIELERREGEVLSLQAINEKLKTEVVGKTAEVRRITMELESANSQLVARKTFEMQTKGEMENTVGKLREQIRESENALNAAKADIEALRKGNAQGRNRDLAIWKEKETDYQREISSLQSDLQTEKRKITELNIQLGENLSQEMDKKNRELEGKHKELMEIMGKMETTQKALGSMQEAYIDLQAQYERLGRDFNLLKDTLQKTEEHNKQLLESLEKRTLTKAREYRERVLNTPSPLRRRSRSPIQDENAGRSTVKPLPLVSSRLVLKEQDLNQASTPPTFRESGDIPEADQDKAAFQLYKNALFSES